MDPISLYERQVESLIGGLEVAPPGKLTVMVGDTVRVTLTVRYRGSAVSGVCYIAFGLQDTWFNEDANKTGQIPVSFGPDSDWETYTITVDIYIGGNTGLNYDLYAKLISLPGPDVFTPTYLNVLDVLGAPEFEDFRITDYSKV